MARKIEAYLQEHALVCVLQYCWRWVGYNYGLDLLIMCRDRYVYELLLNVIRKKIRNAIHPVGIILKKK